MSRLHSVAVATVLLLGVAADSGIAGGGLPGVREHRGPVSSGKVVAPGFAIDFVGVLWDGNARGGEIRFRTKDRWSSWRPLLQDEIEVPGRFASALIGAGKATAFQVRLPRLARQARAVAMNTTVAARSSRTMASSGVITRAEWGADESLRFDAQGDEVWPPAYYPAQVLTVHHTATRNGDIDPAATVRAIYRYHAIDQGWGDIGYHFLIDEQGRVYEGRYSGEDGDPAHETATGNMVTAAHVGGWNSGNLGVALLGNLRTRQPTTAARSSLESVLADLAGRHDLDPLARTDYVNPITAATKNVAVISGHRDWESTECPGTTFYKQLPSVRANVAALIGAPPPTGSIHVAALQGVATSQGKSWTAEVTVTVADDQNAEPVGGATASGTWSSGSSSTCTTDQAGRCTVRLERLRSNTASVSYTISSLAASGFAYDPAANATTSVTVSRP